ncbi:hypothetical protein AMTR_s00138p00103140 [Amborella trichopoda]|uniref:Uncharacterized protein n=1 Tax=Amborella trichopoda TaxID=13333 RepID=W1NEQ5_AMBTC|nr:hypothetical protein AMTR_s00138p00103140 [Amborella trichopoda]
MKKPRAFQEARGIEEIKLQWTERLVYPMQPGCDCSAATLPRTDMSSSHNAVKLSGVIDSRISSRECFDLLTQLP